MSEGDGARICIGEERRPAVAFETPTTREVPVHIRHFAPGPPGAAGPGTRLTSAEAGTLRMVVADLPYARVWSAATFALAGYPIERAADGVIQTGWAERPPGEALAGVERLQERVTVRVEPFGERITRVTVSVEARGWQGGQWVPVADTRTREHAILDGIRDAQDRRP